MVKRQFWLQMIRQAWKKRSVVWLSGVRRVGKTTLSQSIPGIDYFDCELPSVRRRMDDPESFLKSVDGRRIILDEIHRLGNPSQLLKIAADHFPRTKILATGSSTLSASKKFKDTLTGRKSEIWLTPMISDDLADFKQPDLAHRFLHGGLPPFFLSRDLPSRDFQEWMDAYWAKDVQELFRVERRYSFQKFVELLMAQSGGIFEATRFSQPCEVSRVTIGNYLKVLEATLVVTVVKPFNTHRSTEIIAAPKIYGFDTGFVCYHRGWERLRIGDMGILWEHYVLNEIQAHAQTKNMHYWRDKRGHEIDYVLTSRGRPPVAIECKWSSNNFDLAGIQAFRRQYPSGENFVVCQDIEKPYPQRYGDVSVTFLDLQTLIRSIHNPHKLF